MPELFETAIVAKRNVLNELRSNHMTLSELRLFSIYLAKINAWDQKTRIIRFPIHDFQRIMGIGADMNMAHFKLCIRHILQQVVEVPNENGSGYRAFQLFKRAVVEKDQSGEWYVELDAHDEALPLLFDFKNKYFKYELWNALRLKSVNQVRVYELLKQYEGLGRREIAVEDLREMIGIGAHEYAGRTGWSDFKKKVLDSAKRALMEWTDISFTYERGKVGKGGKWLTIIFHISKNQDYKDRITMDDFIRLDPAVYPIGEESDSAEAQSEQEQRDMPEPDDAQTEEDLVQAYGTERLLMLAEACSYEFDKDQMRVIDGMLRGLPIAPDSQTQSLLFGKVFWLSNLYSKFRLAAHQAELYGEPIRNRFRYFCRMIENAGREG